MKKIETLITDIQTVLNTPTKLNEDDAKVFADNIVSSLRTSLAQDQGDTTKLRMSSVGIKCDRKLWYQTHGYEGEKLPPSARLKFLFGHILEALLLLLAKAAGHTVAGEQDTLELNGVLGHRDGVIDGVTVDVKSASNHSFRRFENHLRVSDDSFGYIDQLGSYVSSSKEDSLVTEKDKAAFLVVDKTLGHLTLDIHDYKGTDYAQIVDRQKAVVNQEAAPRRAYFTEKDGESGNEKLSMECSYCPYKRICWPDHQAYAYANGPRYLTTVKKEPNVPRIY